MHLINDYKSYSKKHPLKARILLSLFIIIITLAIIRALLPTAIKIGAHYWFDSNNIKIEIGKIEIALFNGSFAINNVSGESSTGKNFSLDKFKASWQWKQLLNKTAFIKNLEIDTLKADAAFYKDGIMNIAGLVIKPNNDKQIETQTPTINKDTSPPWNAVVETIKLSGIEFCLQQHNEEKTPDVDYCATLASLNWNGSIEFKPSTQDKTAEITPLHVNGTLKLNNIVLKNNKLNLALLDIKAIDIQDINIQTPFNINASRIDINNLTALQRNNNTGANDAQLVAFDLLSIQPISFLNLNNLKLGTIKLNAAQAFLNIDKNGKTDFAKWMPKKTKQKPAAQDTVKINEEPFDFSFDEFIFNTDKHILFVDNSLKETFSTDIHAIDIGFKKLDSHTPNVLSHANVSFKIDKHATFKIETDLMPLAKKISVKGKGEISGLDLRMLAPYTKQFIGHNIKSGQLDTNLKLDIKKGIIDSNIELALHHFELKTLSKKEADELNSEFGFPLNSSLSLLRDKDNTIRLNIPVNGDVANPEFDPSDAIIKASSSAITSSIIQYYTPFGLIFTASALIDLASALNFEPVIFEANMAALTPDHQDQLNKLATLMTERPGIHLTLCGISNMMDKDTLFPAPKNLTAATETKTTAEDPMSKEKLNTLKKLAETRSSAIKNHLVNTKSIKASRLIECAPEYEIDGIPGVLISI